jgi:mannose-6-phosphate isomerase-like protein (cupin superfamily)/CDGSH-type Zn-finger protein
MKTPAIAQAKPCLVEVKKGKTYLWCACGLSKRQPFCDGSHKDTAFEPLQWRAEESGEKLFCACKQTRSEPFCDGSHNSLSESYAEAEEGDGDRAVIVDYRSIDDGALKAELDNGCYVIRVPEAALQTEGAMRIYPVIGEGSGAAHLSQYLLDVKTGKSPIFVFPGSDVALFVVAGQGTVNIGGEFFSISAESGVCIKPGEGFQLINDQAESISLAMAVCPPCSAPLMPATMPDRFDAAFPFRVQGVDEGKREEMADRFFQVLIDGRSHGTPVTQFIGEIPCSRAAHHRHLYEETITVLSGEGFMWTDHTRTPVKPGDTIFLPLKQAHSLECTTPGGMRLMGLFYPSMSPAINY